MMKILVCLSLIVTSSVFAGVQRREIVEEVEKKVQKEFCSKKSRSQALSQCQAWLTEQKKNLGTRVLTTWCSQRESGDTSGCFHRVEGEISYFLRKVVTETPEAK